MGDVAHMEEMRNACNILVGKHGGKRPLRRPGCRCEDNIRIDLRETEWESVDWMHLAQDTDQYHALMNMVMKLWDP
jgi:hypothetical protein